MSKKKYMRGAQIKTVGNFEVCPSRYYIVKYGDTEKTTHRGWMESMQFHYLSMLIHSGRVYAAKEIEK